MYVVRAIKSSSLRWEGHAARIRESNGAYRVLVGKPEGRNLLERTSPRWEDNIKMDRREVGRGRMD